MTRRGHVVEDAPSCERCLYVNFDLCLFPLPESEEIGDEQMKGCEEDIRTIRSVFSNRLVNDEDIPGSVRLRAATLAHQLMARPHQGRCSIRAGEHRSWGIES